MTATDPQTPQTPSTLHDDGFHEPTTDSLYWTETCWFSFFVPERTLSGTLYPLFRKNLGICSSGVHIWDASTHEPARALYDRNYWHLPFPDGDLTDVTLASGLHYRCTEPATRFEMTYADGDEVALDLRFDGVIPPHYIGATHLDQPGHVTGTLTLHGESIPVDCYAIRDRTWSVRDDLHSGFGGSFGNSAYSYAMASPGEGWQALSVTADGTSVVRAGYLVRDGVVSDVVAGERRVVERRDGYQTRVAVRLEDKLGRTLEAEGECHNVFTWQFTPNYLSWICLTHWAWDGGSGWGEDHDNWAPAGWRAFTRNGFRF